MAIDRPTAEDEAEGERVSLHPLTFEQAVKRLFKRKPVEPVEDDAPDT